MNTDLVLNLSRIEFEDAPIQAQIVAYHNSEQLSKLRAEYYASYVFLREWGTRILCVPYVQNAPQITQKSSVEQISLYKHLSVSSALIRNGAFGT